MGAVNGEQAMNGGHQQGSAALLVMQQGCRMQVVVKHLVSGGSEASWVFGTCFRGVFLGVAMYVIILGLLVVVLNWAGQGIW